MIDNLLIIKEKMGFFLRIIFSLLLFFYIFIFIMETHYEKTFFLFKYLNIFYPFDDKILLWVFITGALTALLGVGVKEEKKPRNFNKISYNILFLKILFPLFTVFLTYSTIKITGPFVSIIVSIIIGILAFLYSTIMIKGKNE